MTRLDWKKAKSIQKIDGSYDPSKDAIQNTWSPGPKDHLARRASKAYSKWLNRLSKEQKDSLS